MLAEMPRYTDSSCSLYGRRLNSTRYGRLLCSKKAWSEQENVQCRLLCKVSFLENKANSWFKKCFGLSLKSSTFLHFSSATFLNTFLSLKTYPNPFQVALNSGQWLLDSMRKRRTAATEHLRPFLHFNNRTSQARRTGKRTRMRDSRFGKTSRTSPVLYRLLWTQMVLFRVEHGKFSFVL